MFTRFLCSFLLVGCLVSAEATFAEVINQGADASESASTSADSTLPKVEIYVTSWCGYCKKAKSFFAARKIPFTIYDIEKDDAAARRMARINPRGGVPVTVINGQVFRGFSEEVYASALEGSR